VLLTGFQGYGGRSANPSEAVARALDGARVAGTRVAGRVLPVEYAELRARIERLVAEHRPVAVLCLGLWPGEPTIRLERFALNLADFEIADNAGAIEKGPLAPEGALARASTLPLERVRSRLLAAGIPARLSSTAGHFLCNALMYHALGAVEARGEPAAPCGFAHLPYLPGQVADLVAGSADTRLELHQRADLASMALETQIEGVRIAIETTLEAIARR